MIYTDPRKTPLLMPNGTYSILSFAGDIVDDQHQPVPLSKVYDHHWIALNSVHHNQICHEEYVFGIGAESRNNPQVLPAGYGYLVDSPKVTWSANIHLLRTEGLKGDNPQKAAKECNECYYAPTKGAECTPKHNGTFQCCGEKDFKGVASCPTKLVHPPEANYYLRYQVQYTRDTSSVKPIIISIATAPDCAAFYDVLRNDDQPERADTYEYTVPKRATVLYAVGHQHTGALNISMYVNGKRTCTSYPTYGTQVDVPGNESGYLVKMSLCIDESTGPLHLQKGDVVKIESWYYVGSNDPRVAYSDGTHLNVMGYMYLAYVGGSGTSSEEEVLGQFQPRAALPHKWYSSEVRGTTAYYKVPETTIPDIVSS
uniref:Uncharacterized protein n=1 Tax=Haptolina ericina TaxID=156174 RepID=A0A6T9LG12_9EUKA